MPHDEDNLIKVLADYDDVGGVSLNWINFGTSGISRLAPDRLVIESFTRRAQIDDPANYFVKTISRAERIRRCKDPHAMLYDIGFKQVDARKLPMYASMSNTVVDYRMRINHYWTRDESYFWQQKVAAVKERGDLIALQELNRRFVEFNAVEDGLIQRFVPEVKARLAARNLDFVAEREPVSVNSCV